MPMTSATPLRILLIVLGLINIFIGINVAFGGIQTLGWQGQTDFVEIADEYAFLLHDSHIRFFGGIYIGIGAFLVLASADLRKYHTALSLVLILIFMGGLARFTMLRPDIIFGPDIIGSLLAELVLMPVLFVWLRRITARSM